MRYLDGALILAVFGKAEIAFEIPVTEKLNKKSIRTRVFFTIMGLMGCVNVYDQEKNVYTECNNAMVLGNEKELCTRDAVDRTNHANVRIRVSVSVRHGRSVKSTGIVKF